MDTPAFTTARLVLKPPTTADIAAYQRHFCDYEVIRQLSAAVPWPYPEDGVAAFFAEHVIALQGRDRWFWGLFLEAQPTELIGMVDLWRKGRPENRGFWLGRRFWAHGYMTEAVAPITTYAFEALGFEELVFSNAVGNHRSRRIKEKTGARFLRVEAAGFVDPSYAQREVWQLTKDDWQRHLLARPVRNDP